MMITTRSCAPGACERLVAGHLDLYTPAMVPCVRRAVAYFKCTGHQPTNARSGRQRRLPPFFRLAQICTRLSDPGRFIAKLPRPFKGEGLEDFQPLPE
jgi:hypothetical protein